MPTDAPPPPVPLASWQAGGDGTRVFLNATGVDLDGRGLLFLGATGAGKSALALALMAQGARLVSDDGIWAEPEADATDPDAIALVRPDTAPAMIEARGVGLLDAGPISARTPLALAVDLDHPEPDRLPPSRRVELAGRTRPLILGAGHPGLAPALLHMVRHGRAVP